MAWFDELNLPGATVDGHVGYVRADGPDDDDYPDVALASGSVTFTATTPAARVDGAWLGIESVKAQIFEGKIVVSEEDPRPVRLLATDAPIGVADWAWKATFQIDGFKLDTLAFKAPRGETVNLTADMIPIKSQPYQIIEGASIVDTEVDTAGERMRFKMSDGTFTKWVSVPNGEPGAKGDPGVKGDPGADGQSPTIAMGSVSAGANADAWMTGPPLARELHLTLPRGPKGDTGNAVLMRGLIPEGANVDEYTAGESRGEWYIPTTAIAKTITGLPDEFRSPGPFKVLAGPPGYAYTAQMFWPRLSPTEGATLTRHRTGVDTWSAWKRIDAPASSGGGDPFEPVATGMRNADLLDLLVQRKGGSIGTNGKAAFALRLDHGTTAFRDHLGPLLKKYGLPSTMAVYSKQNEVNAANHDVPWSQVASWHHSHGMSFGNHSDDHLDKPDAEGWYGGTIGSLGELKALMPNVPVEQYIPHGSVGYDRYGGFNRAASHGDIVGTLAGRMALSSHALIAGYRGDRFRPLRGRPMQGETHWSMEEASVASFKSMIDAAINRTQGLAVMFHPEFIGLNGKMTWAMVEECLAYVARKRDEGLIVPLTLDGLAVADTRNDWRDDLIDPPQALMQDPATIYGNFTETPGAFTSSTPGRYVRHSPSLANRGWAYGGTRTAQWHVSSQGGATVTLNVQEGTDTPPWVSTRTVTVPVGESVLYLPFGLPLTLAVQTLRLELTLDAGDITVHECHAYAS